MHTHSELAQSKTRRRVTEVNIPPLSKLNVLLVDDSQVTRKILSSYLDDIGVSNIYQASNGKEALAFIHESYEKINMIICDWVMPEMDGAELLKHIRQLDADIPFVMVSSVKNTPLIQQAKNAGVTDYILKPVDLSHMRKKLFSIHNKMFKTERYA